jgi:hypothetical protein
MVVMLTAKSVKERGSDHDFDQTEPALGFSYLKVIS